jgi:hypothetical protein
LQARAVMMPRLSHQQAEFQGKAGV